MLIALLLTATRVDMKSQPAQVVLGADSSAQIMITAAPEVKEADVHLSVNVGSVSKLSGDGKGHFTATYTPPSKRFPQVALFLAKLKQAEGHAWLAVPLLAKSTLTLETKPRAKVTLSVGEKTFEAKADKSGTAKVPVVVPPGVTSASVRAVDPAGNEKTSTLPLEPPPFQRVRILAPHGNVTSWTESGGLPIEVFVVSSTGAPAASADITLTASGGQLSALTPVQPGVFTATFKAPDKAEAVKIRAATADGLGDETGVVADAGPAHHLEITLTPPEALVADNKPVLVTTLVLDAKGNRIDGQALIKISAGELKRIDALHVEVTPPANWREAKNGVDIEALLPPLTAKTVLRLKAGIPVYLGVTAGKGFVHAGEPVGVRALVLDAGDNPVAAPGFAVSAPPGQLVRSVFKGNGRYKLVYQLPARTPVGPSQIDVRTSDGSLKASAPLYVLPAQKRWGLALGGGVDFVTDFTAHHAISILPEVSVRVSPWPIDLTLAVGARVFIPITSTDAAGVTRHEQTVGLPILLGARANWPVSERWRLFLSGVTGPQIMWYRLTASNGIGNTTLTVPFVLGVGFGASVVLGPGRGLMELFAQTTNGVGLRVGYLYDLL